MIWSIIKAGAKAAAKSKAQTAAKKNILKPLKQFKFRIPVLKAYERLGTAFDTGKDYVGQRLWNFLGGDPMKYPGFMGTPGMTPPSPDRVVPFVRPTGESTGPQVYGVTRPAGGPQVINYYG